MGNSGMIAGAFSSVSGKADTVLTTNGDVLYYNSGRQRLAIGSEGTVLTVSSSDLPAWETVSAGANTALSNLSSVSVNDTIDMNTNTLKNTKWHALKAEATLTISTGEVTGSQSNLKIDTEGSASTDDLNSCTGLAPGALTYQRQTNDARDVTWIQNATPGNNRFTMNADFTATSRFDFLTFIQNAANDSGAIWLCISTRDNG